MSDFQEYLSAKKIDSQSFETEAKKVFDEWQGHFEQMSSESFTAQKLFLINNIRRKFPLKENLSPPPTKKPAAKPKIKPKINP